MRIARRETQITARNLASPAIAGRMFSRWCQEIVARCAFKQRLHFLSTERL